MLHNTKIIKTFFPKNIIYEIGEISKYNNEILYREELDIIKRSCEKRKNEFVAGRVISKNIVKMLGVENFPILSGKFREPIWPTKIVGSISHCEDCCFVAISEKKYLKSIGVDIESNNILPVELEDIVCTLSERNWIQLLKDRGCSLPLSKMVFCAKESVYKCIFPFVGRFVDFHEAEINFQLSSSSFKVKMFVESNEVELFQEIIDIRGFVFVYQRHIYSLAYLTENM